MNLFAGLINSTELQDKVEVYENILHSLHFASSVTMDRERVGNILDKIGAWSYAQASDIVTKAKKELGIE